MQWQSGGDVFLSYGRRNVLGFRNNKLIRINNLEIRSPDDVREALDDVAGGEIVSLHFLHPTLGERVVNVRMPE